MDAARAAEAAARQGYGRLLAYLVARTRDVAAAEDALSDAFAAALQAWPRSGIPDRPEAWLLTAARRRLTDQARRRRVREDATQAIVLAAEERADAEPPPIPDERLGLLFTCAHPAIEASVRAPLLLQTVLGLDAATIASAFLVAPAAMGQRLSRAKAKLRDAGIAFRVPEGPELGERLGTVLDAIYAAFALGDGTGAAESPLAEEACFLALLVASLLPQEAEALGLAALILHVTARRAARRGADGAFVPLAQQDPRLWEAEPARDAERLLLRAASLGRPGRFQTEAAIQSVHAARARTGVTDWLSILALYDVLHRLTGSPVVALNREAARAEAGDPQGALEALTRLGEDGRLRDYQPHWAALGTIAARLGRSDVADAALGRAIALAIDPAVQQHLARIRAGLV